ncbi:MAG: cell division protein ZapA [Ruminococcus sp.]|nr:cell division protein ZapA [Ruminococcus sp.]
MEKNKITVFVAGQKLTLITEESEKYVTDISQKVDTAISSLFNNSGMSREKCAVMAALDFCDDEAKSRASLSKVKEQIKDYIEDSAKLRAENEKLKERIAELEKEIENKKKEPLASAIAPVVEIKKTKTTEVVEEFEIDSSDDLSFDFDEDAEKEVEKLEPKTVKPTPKSEKKRHNHEHVNPYKERFMQKQNNSKGYTPMRQYSLFEDNKNDE